MKRWLLVFIFIIFASTVFADSLCDYKVELIVESEEFKAEDFKWKMRAINLEGGPTNITGTAEIQQNGTKVKSYKPWTSQPISRQKTSSEYSPNLKPGKYEIIAEIKVECNDIDNSSNKAIKQITIIAEDGQKESKNQEVKKEATAETIPTADEIKNNEEKETVNYTNVAQEATSKKPEYGENVILLTEKSNLKNQQQSTEAKETQIAYVSSNEKAKDLIVMFLLVLSILLNIILIWKR